GSTSLFCQNNSVGIGTLTPDNSAILELESVSQGFLMTRLNTSQINSITAPSEGVIVYNLDDKCYWFHNNNNWNRLCNTDSIVSLINSYGDTLGYIYDSLAVHNINISNNTTNIQNLTTIINNHSDSLDWIYDSLGVHSTNIYNNTTNIQNLSDSLGWVYDSLKVHNTNIFNLFDSISIINNHLGTIDSTLLEKWDLNGNSLTNSATNFLGTTDNVDLVFRTNGTEKVRVRANGNVGIGTTLPTEKLDINSNAIRIRTGATNNYVLSTNATGVGTWQDPAINPLITPLGNDWKLAGNAATVADFIGTTTNVDFVIKTNGAERGRIKADGSVLYSGASGITPTTGIGTRMMWIPSKATFHAGILTHPSTAAYWDNVNIGTGNATFGLNTLNSGSYSLVSGFTNTNRGVGNFVTGGISHYANNNASMSFMAGEDNTINSTLTSKGNGIIGFRNRIIGNSLTINHIFGAFNTITSGGYNMVIGYSNQVAAPHTFTSGRNLTNNTSNSFLSVYAGGYTLHSNHALTTGVVLNPGSGAWATLSDVNTKTNIQYFDTENDYSVLDKFENIKVGKWSYIAQTVNYQNKLPQEEKLSNPYCADIYHIGPMSQDFYKVFGGLGTSEKRITTVDISGVNMLGIKALIEKNKSLEAQVQEMAKQLEELKQLINK
ncbi:MAG: hypothetical protein COB15_11400, partial [Flavobacteriales bacterium]